MIFSSFFSCKKILSFSIFPLTICKEMVRFSSGVHTKIYTYIKTTFINDEYENNFWCHILTPYKSPDYAITQLS